jgi:uncharacterized membrane protein YgaE (UPF0421/DUF939 family)
MPEQRHAEAALGTRSHLQLAIRAAVAATIAAAIAQALKLDYPIYALLAAIIVTDLTPGQSRQLALRRLAATLIGVLSGALVSVTLPPTAWSAGLAILCTMFAAHLLKVRSSAKVAAYIAAIVLLHFSPQPWSHALNRVVETVLGVTVAWAIAFIPLLLRNEQVNSGERDAGEHKRPWFHFDPEPALSGHHLLITDAQLAIRTAAAATLAILITQLLRLDYPVFAAIAAVITTDLAPLTSRQLGARRIMGTIIGAACGALMSVLLPADTLWLGVGLLITMLVCQLVNAPEGAKLAACTCGICMVMHGGEPALFAFHRVVETSIGIASACAVSYLPKLISLSQRHEQSGSFDPH